MAARLARICFVIEARPTNPTISPAVLAPLPTGLLCLGYGSNVPILERHADVLSGSYSEGSRREGQHSWGIEL